MSVLPFPESEDQAMPPQTGSALFSSFSSSFPFSPRHSVDAEASESPCYSDTETESDSPYSSPFLEIIRNDADSGTAVHPELSFQFGFGSAAPFDYPDTGLAPFSGAATTAPTALDYGQNATRDQPTLQRLASDGITALRPAPLNVTVSTTQDDDITMKPIKPSALVLADAPSLIARVPSETEVTAKVEPTVKSEAKSEALPTSRKRARSPSRRVTRTSSRRQNAKQDDDDVITIGEYTKAERRAKIARFMDKRKRRKWTHGLMLRCRQVFATNRPRVNGRFVKLPKAICPLIAKGVDMRGYDLKKAPAVAVEEAAAA